MFNWQCLSLWAPRHLEPGQYKIDRTLVIKKNTMALWVWTVGALAFCERKYLEFYNICLIIIFFVVTITILYNHWLRIIFWITVLHSWCCWFQDVLKMTSWQSCQSNRLTQNLQPETWNSSIRLCSFVDSLGPRRFCGGPNGWSLKRVAWKQG